MASSTRHKWVFRANLALLLAACGGADVAPRAPAAHTAAPPSELRVALFQYIPPFGDLAHSTLAERLRREFLAETGINAHIEFRETYGLTPSSPEFAIGADAFDLVEIDLMGLRALDSVVATWQLASGDVAPAALNAASIDRRIAAWPTYMCGFFVTSFDPGLRTVATSAELVSWLGKGQPLVGDFNGSSTLPPIYYDAYLDTHGTAAHVDDKVDQSVLESLRAVLKRCDGLNADNRCLNDSYDLYDGKTSGIERLVARDARALFGYSEYLYYVLASAGGKVVPADLSITSAPLGHGSHPALFTDGLVINARRCTAPCVDKAQRFAEFLTSPSTQTMIAYGEEEASGSHSATPRYLLMARTAFWNSERVEADPIYSQLRSVVLDAKTQSFGPTSLSRDAIRDALLTGTH